MTAIAHDPARQRFTTEADGQAACLEYERAVGLMTITHTIVPPDIGGRGIAGDLVRTALEYARAEGVKVTPRGGKDRAELNTRRTSWGVFDFASPRLTEWRSAKLMKRALRLVMALLTSWRVRCCAS